MDQNPYEAPQCEPKEFVYKPPRSPFVALAMAFVVVVVGATIAAGLVDLLLSFTKEP